MEKFKLEEGKIIPASYDPVFKALLTADECREYLADIIHMITKIPKDIIINNTKIKNGEHMKSNVKEKLDISIIKKVTGLSEEQIIDINNGK